MRCFSVAARLFLLHAVSNPNETKSARIPGITIIREQQEIVKRM